MPIDKQRTAILMTDRVIKYVLCSGVYLFAVSNNHSASDRRNAGRVYAAYLENNRPAGRKSPLPKIIGIDNKSRNNDPQCENMIHYAYLV